MGRLRARQENVTGPCIALREWVAVAHHMAKARAAFGEARTAPDAWHRDRAMGQTFTEIDAAEARLVALIETQPGIRMRCRRKMVEVDALAGQVHTWAATLQRQPAEVIHLAALDRSSAARAPRKADRRPSVNENLLIATDDAPAAC